MQPPVIETRSLKKDFYRGEIVVPALRSIDIRIEPGEFVAIMGASGSGKSTLMNLLGCLDQPTSGSYYLDGCDVGAMSREQYASIRNEKIGFVFQGFNLLPRMSALENVELPLDYKRNGDPSATRGLAAAALARVGLADRMDHEPGQLSGGQQQRTAIARALINNPSLILADEPTGNLDSRTSIEIMMLFQELNEQGITLVIVTHEFDIAWYARRMVEMKDGMIVRDMFLDDRRIAADDYSEIRKKTILHPAAVKSGIAVPACL